MVKMGLIAGTASRLSGRRASRREHICATLRVPRAADMRIDDDVSIYNSISDADYPPLSRSGCARS
jgi:hypothetical protein